MRNIIQLLLRYQITLLFIALEVIAFVLVVTSNSHHQIKYLSATAEFSGYLHQQVNDITSYLSLASTNEELAKENANLRNLMKSNFQGDVSPFQQFVDSSYQQSYTYKQAEVVSSTVDRRNNYLIINKGKRHGIAPDMGVISPKGVVGIIKEVSANYATVMPLIHSKTKISTQLKANRYFGILEWKGYNPKEAQLADIPSHVNLTQGDTVITRGASGIFPKGILVGTVNRWEEMPSTSFYDIHVDLATNFYSLSFVYVVANVHKEEFLQLIESAESDGE